MMNENAIPNSASASINPIPINMVVRTWLAYSGCRAIASTDLPIRMPKPMPGPIAARPITSPLPTVLIESRFPVTCASKWIINASFSMLLREGAADVRGGQHREDERLQQRNEDLEADQEHRERERHPGQDPRLRGTS